MEKNLNRNKASEQKSQICTSNDLTFYIWWLCFYLNKKKIFLQNLEISSLKKLADHESSPNHPFPAHPSILPLYHSCACWWWWLGPRARGRRPRTRSCSATGLSQPLTQTTFRKNYCFAWKTSYHILYLCVFIYP